MIEERKFGRTIAGEDIVLYSLKNKNGMQADVMNFGAILVNLFVPDKNGEVKDVVLGYDRAKDYFVNGSCFGSTIGPVANRTIICTVMEMRDCIRRCGRRKRRRRKMQ